MKVTLSVSNSLELEFKLSFIVIHSYLRRILFWSSPEFLNEKSELYLPKSDYYMFMSEKKISKKRFTKKWNLHAKR